MGCNCKIMEIVLGIVILILTLWPMILGAKASMWIVVVAAALLVIHALTCKNCGACEPMKQTSKRK